MAANRLRAAEHARGVNVVQMWILREGDGQEALRLVLGLVLLILMTGFWACLWVSLPGP
jgi:hypothetical protein